MRLTSVFDLDALLPLLKDFYDITGIRLTVFDADLHELVSWPSQQPPFCQCVRSREEGLAACRDCDAEAFRCASLGKAPHVYICHAGLMEAALPLHVGDALVGYLGCGHVFAYPSRGEGLQIISEKTKQLGLDVCEIALAADTHPNLTEGYMRAAARIMQATASYLILERMATLQEDSAAAQLDAYLNAHFFEALTAESIGMALRMSRSRIYRLCEQLYGCGLKAQVRRLRLNLARQLLHEHPGLSVAQVAEKCGFADYNYFIALFSKTNGISPQAYRKQKQP